ncbi:hypothetical protein C5E45_14240 [Nocardia nova]|uniref:Uncharacterized protein n=1 Tax=Nocardia nova TaxID=37330 RepID=A0A2S6ARG5_9NOCA|nr:hypothetical protein [Nocardia nova]PPJ27444.1 hypothetical protein C5E41_16155 [Nocardia nova]PPJ37786.1 hypothetical protein C5E45_14240 [Nocardia nova]
MSHPRRTEIAPTVSVRVPTCHFAEFAGAGAEFTQLLDDLAPARQGEQIADARCAGECGGPRRLPLGQPDVLR